MNELSARAKELRAKTWTKIGFDTNDEDFTQRYDKLIEQALLAERRLVWAEAVRIGDMYDGAGATFGTAKSLRAAAEKEGLTK